MKTHEDAMLSPKRSDVAVYYFLTSPVFRSTRGTDGYVLVYAWSLHRPTCCCFLRIHGNRPRAALTANCIMPDERSIDAHLLHPRASMPISELPKLYLEDTHVQQGCMKASLRRPVPFRGTECWTAGGHHDPISNHSVPGAFTL